MPPLGKWRAKLNDRLDVQGRGGGRRRKRMSLEHKRDDHWLDGENLFKNL